MTIIDADTGEVVAGFQVMPDLDVEVRAALRDSIERFGVLEPIYVTPDGQIIDGHNRWDIAMELGVPCETRVYEVSSPEEARDLATTLNMDRRHLDRGTRATLAKSLRAQGHSLRAIAGALGVGKTQVARDLDEVDEVPLSPDGTVVPHEASPEGITVVGVDGREQPATRRGPWSPDELLELLDAYEQALEAGTSQPEYAESSGMSLNNLKNLLVRARKIRKGEAPVDKLQRVAENIRVQQITEAAAEGLTSRQIAAKLGVSFQQVRAIASRNGVEVPADAVVGKSRLLQSSRIANETVLTLEGLASSLRLIDISDIDPADCGEWVISLSESLRVLTRFTKQLKEMTRESE